MLLHFECHAIQLTLYAVDVEAGLFRKQTSQLGLGESVVCSRGPTPNEVALAEFHESNIGVMPHWADEAWNTAIHNKLFDCMKVLRSYLAVS